MNKSEGFMVLIMVKLRVCKGWGLRF